MYSDSGEIERAGRAAPCSAHSSHRTLTFHWQKLERGETSSRGMQLSTPPCTQRTQSATPDHESCKLRTGMHNRAPAVWHVSGPWAHQADTERQLIKALCSASLLRCASQSPVNARL
jgi:hypothetical protein